MDQIAANNSLADALECYIGGRRIFQSLSDTPSQYSSLALGALRNWLKGALAAYRKEPSYGRDEKLVYAVEQFEQKAEQETVFARRWQREFASTSNYKNQFGEYKALEFVFGHEVDRLLAANDVRAADIVTNGLMPRINGTQAPFAEMYGVTREMLIKLQEQVKARKDTP